mmetsp:Transcript_14642/g.39188  ORF Transcript_14642/g.39188 Transcript_14642/m.39188 type:complete len:269 (+) Transcript_14642:1380-2186(+)
MICCETAEVRPDSSSCLCDSTSCLARPRPLSSSPCPVNTPTSVDLPASTLPATAMRRSRYSSSEPGTLLTRACATRPLCPSDSCTIETSACSSAAMRRSVAIDAASCSGASPRRQPLSSTPSSYTHSPWPSVSRNCICVTSCTIRSLLGFTSDHLYSTAPSSSSGSRSCTSVEAAGAQSIFTTAFSAHLTLSGLPVPSAPLPAAPAPPLLLPASVPAPTATPSSVSTGMLAPTTSAGLRIAVFASSTITPSPLRAPPALCRSTRRSST